MNLCLACHQSFNSLENNCPNCGFGPTSIAGFDAYAPEFADTGKGFKASYFAEFAQLEADNFWFCARNRLISWTMKKYCPHFRSFLEIGCGTAFVLTNLAQAFPDATFTGSEIFTAGLSIAAQRLPSAKFIQMDALQVPFVEEFDAIGAFDVLEHIEDDLSVLSQIHTALKTQGYLILTVPQHRWLWSATDEYACHVRRYSADELHQKIVAAGFEIIRSTSFVSTLLPVMMASRLFQRNTSNSEHLAELKIPSLLNTIFATILGGELRAIKSGINFSLGGSRLVIAQKQ